MGLYELITEFAHPVVQSKSAGGGLILHPIKQRAVQSAIRGGLNLKTHLSFRNTTVKISMLFGIVLIITQMMI